MIPMAAATVRVETMPDRAGLPVVRVHATGEIDCGNASLLGQALAAALARGAGRLEVDLAEVTFIDCAGVRELLKYAEDAAAGRLRLVAASECVGWLLRKLDMQQRFSATGR